jgi:phospholipase D1/2
VDGDDRRGWLLWALVLFFFIAVAAFWRWAPAADRLDFSSLANYLVSLRDDPRVPYVILAAYLIGSLIMFPIVLLIAVTAYALGPVAGFAYAMLGSLLGAVATYGVGCWLGGRSPRRPRRGRLAALHRTLRAYGLIAVITTHLLPVAPFTLVNFVAGAARVRFRDFVLGTAIGMFPGVLAITLFERQLENALRDPTVERVLLVAALALTLLAATVWARRRWLRGEPPFLETAKPRDPGGRHRERRPES